MKLPKRSLRSVDDFEFIIHERDNREESEIVEGSCPLVCLQHEEENGCVFENLLDRITVVTDKVPVTNMSLHMFNHWRVIFVNLDLIECIRDGDNCENQE